MQKSNKSYNVYDPTISSCVVEYKQSSIYMNIYITINLNRLIILKMFLETTRIIFVTAPKLSFNHLFDVNLSEW
jgi:hypothetical protein